MPSDEEELPQFRLRADDGDDGWASVRGSDGADATRRPTYQLPVQPRVAPLADPAPPLTRQDAASSTSTGGDGVAVVEYDGTGAPEPEVVVGDGVNWRPILIVVASLTVVVMVVGAVNSVVADDRTPFRETRPYIADLVSARVLVDPGPSSPPTEQWRTDQTSRCNVSSVRLVGDVLVVATFVSAPELQAFDLATGEPLWTIEVDETSREIVDLDRGRFLAVQPNDVSIRSVLNGAEIVGTARARDDGIFVRGDRIVVMRIDETAVLDLDLNPILTLGRVGRRSFVGDNRLYDISAGAVRAIDIDGGTVRWSVEVARADAGLELDDVIVVVSRSGKVVGLDRDTGETVFERNDVVEISPIGRTAFALRPSGGGPTEIVDETGQTQWDVDASFVVAITNGPPVVVTFDQEMVVRDIGSGEQVASFAVPVGASADGLYVKDDTDPNSYRHHALVDGEERWRIELTGDPCAIEAAGDGLVVVDDDGLAFWR